MKHRVTRFLLACLTVVLAALAAATLFPHTAKEANALGYFSYCPFAPVSTLMLSVPAYMIWKYRAKLLADDGRGRP